MKTNGLVKILIPGLTVFVSSGCIMVIELVASRLIARHLGSSLYTWTSVIGVVLAGITLGNYIGGRVADKYKPRKSLSALFCLASIACILIVILNNAISNWFWLWTLSWPVRVFIHVAIVFLLPSVALGTISPVVAKMALDQGLPTGRTVGDLYACGAAGSIAGTFLAGFLLIDILGTVAIIWTIAFLLLGLAIVYQLKTWPLYLWGVILILLYFLGHAKTTFAQRTGFLLRLREKQDPTILYQDETPYCWVAVKQISENPDRRLFLQDKLKHSEISMHDITDLQYFYTKIFAGLTFHFIKDIKHPSLLVIGGGGYAFPQYLLATYPDSTVDVAEIDPGVTEAAHAAFGLPRNTTIKTINLDARNHIDDVLQKNLKSKTPKYYDVIFEDAINDYCVPFQLVTYEFNEKIRALLRDDGLYLINLIDTYDNAQFLGAIVSTLQKTFPYVHILSSKETFSGLRDTYVVAASGKSFNPILILKDYDPLMKVKHYQDAEYDYIIQKAGGIILTDDYAPVENLLAPVVRQSGKELLAAEFLRLAKEFKSKNQLDKSLVYFKRAAEKNPSMTILAYNEIGLIYATLGQTASAINAFKKAIDFYYTEEGNQPIIGSLHMNLGILYAQINETENTSKQLKLAIDRFQDEIHDNPQNSEAWNRMGDCYAMLGQLNEASKCFRKAVEYSPRNHIYYGNLVRSLELQGRYKDAIECLIQEIDLLQKESKYTEAAQLQLYLQHLQSKTNK